MKHINIIALILPIILIYSCEPRNNQPVEPEKDYIILTQEEGRAAPNFNPLIVDSLRQRTNFMWIFDAVDSNGNKYRLSTDLILTGILPELFGTYDSQKIPDNDCLLLHLNLIRNTGGVLNNAILWGTCSILEHHDDYYEIEYILTMANYDRYYFLYKGDITTERISNWDIFVESDF